MVQADNDPPKLAVEIGIIVGMIAALTKLKRATHKVYGKAPHKPVLLLAVIEQIEAGNIAENKIYITAEIIATFQKLWTKLMPLEGWQPRFFLPFFHLTGDKFWYLKKVDGAEVALTASYSPKSISALKDSIHYALVEEALWRQLSNPNEREAIRQLLLHTYFPQNDYRKGEIQRETADYVRQLELNFLENRAADPVEKKYRLVEYEARSTFFKLEVPKIYNYTCAISGMRVTATTDVQLVDACHIEPWSQTKNDTIQNGITLTPTLHRAFDRHLISINQDYRVIVSSNITEEASSPYGIRQFAGKEILLPEKKEWWPNQEAIAKHRSELI